MKLFYDLHIHSALSPCADDEMTPNNIVNMARLKGLDVIAITDHNAMDNLPAFVALTRNTPLLFIPGMEVQTKEDIHVLCLFETLEDIRDFNTALEPYRQRFPHRPERFGTQMVLDETDCPIGERPDSLLLSLTISFGTLREMTTTHHGLFIPAHIGRASYSVLSQLGFLPPDSGITAIEINGTLSHDPYAAYHILTNSDAHQLGDILEPIQSIEVEERSVKSIFDVLRRPVQ